MALTVLTVVILILIAAYAAFFAMLNPQLINVATLRDTHNVYWQTVPVWVLPVAGLLIGALVMALALWGPWSQMRRASAFARQQLAAEREKSNQRAKRVNALLKQVKQLKGQTGSAEDEGSADEDTP